MLSQDSNESLKMKYALVLLGLALTSILFADKLYLGDTTLSFKKMADLTIVGDANLDNITAKTLSITGQLNASNITADSFSVTGSTSLTKGTLHKISITGSASLSDVTSDTVTIIGDSDFKNVTIAKECTIVGILNSENSKFNKVTLSMTDSTLTDTSAASIKIKAPSQGHQQQLKVYGNTRIDKISFKSGQGEVHVHGDKAHVSQVIGGNILRHK